MLHLPDELAAAVLIAAGRSYPSECCGLIEGIDTLDGWRALAVHEAANLAEEPSRRFLIDPEVQFRLLRSLRGSERRIIGCFHSHPDGPPEPSATDAASACETDFLWLIAGGALASGLTLRAYVVAEEGGFSAVDLRDDG